MFLLRVRACVFVRDGGDAALLSAPTSAALASSKPPPPPLRLLLLLSSCLPLDWDDVVGTAVASTLW